MRIRELQVSLKVHTTTKPNTERMKRHYYFKMFRGCGQFGYLDPLGLARFRRELQINAAANATARDTGVLGERDGRC